MISLGPLLYSPGVGRVGGVGRYAERDESRRGSFSHWPTLGVGPPPWESGGADPRVWLSSTRDAKGRPTDGTRRGPWLALIDDGLGLRRRGPFPAYSTTGSVPSDPKVASGTPSRRVRLRSLSGLPARGSNERSKSVLVSYRLGFPVLARFRPVFIIYWLDTLPK